MTRILAFDTETRGFDWAGGETAFLATTADATQEWAYDLSEPEQVNAFSFQLGQADVLVAHNLSFDVHQVRASIDLNLLDYGKVLEDTDLMARVAWPEGNYGDHDGFSLGALTTAFLGRDGKAGFEAIEEAAKALDYRGIKSKPGAYYDVWRSFPDVMEKYAKLDARDTYDLYIMLRDYLDEEEHAGQKAIYELERRVVPILIRAEARGTAVDPPRVDALANEYANEEARLSSKLQATLGEEALGGKGSEAALIEALLKQGVPLREKTESGQFATNQFALAEFEDEFPILRDYLEHRHVQKFLSTYIHPMSGREVVNPSFRQIGTWTGRMSCVRPNMQNIPVRAGSEVRDVFIARPGYKLVVADYDNIEVRLLAYYLGPAGQAYRDLINEGHDPHGWMAAKLYGGSMEDYAKGTPKAHLRAKAKNKATFPIVYGAGGKKLCKLNGLPTGPLLTEKDWMVQKGYAEAGTPSHAQGKALARDVRNAIPGYNSLMRRVKDKIATEGYITTIMGRKQAVARDKGYVGMAALIQGSAADVMKSGLIKVAERLPDDCHILLTVHDEVVVEVPEDDANTVLGMVCGSLSQAYELDPPLLVSGVICDRYGEAK